MNENTLNADKVWNTAIYLRLSKEDAGSENESESIRNQRDLILSHLKSHLDINIKAEYCDDGVSGVNFDRPSFANMLDDIRLGLINCVIVKDECVIITQTREKLMNTGFLSTCLC